MAEKITKKELLKLKKSGVRIINSATGEDFVFESGSDSNIHEVSSSKESLKLISDIADTMDRLVNEIKSMNVTVIKEVRKQGSQSPIVDLKPQIEVKQPKLKPNIVIKHPDVKPNIEIKQPDIKPNIEIKQPEIKAPDVKVELNESERPKIYRIYVRRNVNGTIEYVEPVYKEKE